MHIILVRLFFDIISYKGLALKEIKDHDTIYHTIMDKKLIFTNKAPDYQVGVEQYVVWDDDAAKVTKLNYVYLKLLYLNQQLNSYT